MVKQKPKQTVKPIDQVRIGSIKAAIWRNEAPEGASNTGGPRFNVTFQRIYRDAEGKWHSTPSFGRNDLLVLAKLADLAFTRIHELQRPQEEPPKE